MLFGLKETWGGRNNDNLINNVSSTGPSLTISENFGDFGIAVASSLLVLVCCGAGLWRWCWLWFV